MTVKNKISLKEQVFEEFQNLTEMLRERIEEREQEERRALFLKKVKDVRSKLMMEQQIEQHYSSTHLKDMLAEITDYFNQISKIN
ncbi:hypothetical protein [Algivirga pacifica]|uniref:Uncharacterized protein n=1 Tax=Algivirga pacifica TaxID=1162670 RepID=A0ABP9DIP5_9BACT